MHSVLRNKQLADRLINNEPKLAEDIFSKASLSGKKLLSILSFEMM